MIWSILGFDEVISSSLTLSTSLPEIVYFWMIVCAPGFSTEITIGFCYFSFGMILLALPVADASETCDF